MTCFNKTVQIRLLFAASLVLGGCGGGGSGSDSATSQPPTSPTAALSSGGVAADVTTINSVSVPPDPGAPAKASLAGVDTNGNGVRDEVEREIAAYVGTAPDKHVAALGFARKLQIPLAAPITTSADALESVTNELKAFECLAAALGDRDEALAIADAITARSYNTKTRLTEHTRVYDLSGLVVLPKPGAASCS